MTPTTASVAETGTDIGTDGPVTARYDQWMCQHADGFT